MYFQKNSSKKTDSKKKALKFLQLVPAFSTPKPLSTNSKRSFADGFLQTPVKIEVQDIELEGDLTVPESPIGLVIFVHGSGSSHKSPRNQHVAKSLNSFGFATLLFDLLSPGEDEYRPNVFDITLLSERLIIVTEWARKHHELRHLPIGYFGASTGAAAALVAAAQDKGIASVVSRGGRPDLAKDLLYRVECPTLLIVGGKDTKVLTLNKEAHAKLKSGHLVVIPGATHLFPEKGALEEVVEFAADWFKRTMGLTAPFDANDPDTWPIGI